MFVCCARVTAPHDSSLVQVTTEPVMIPHWIRGHEYARLIAPHRNKTMNMVGLGESIGTPNGQPLIAEVLVVDSFDDLTQKAAQAVGKIVLFNEKWVSYSETVAYRVNGATEVAKVGGVACLIRSVAPYGLQTPHAGSSNTATIPTAALTLEDAEMLARMQARGDTIFVELYMEAHFEPDRPSRNVLIEITGTDFPNEYVTVGGHIDSWVRFVVPLCMHECQSARERERLHERT